MNLFLVWSFREDWRLEWYFAVVQPGGVEVETLERHCVLIWFLELYVRNSEHRKNTKERVEGRQISRSTFKWLNLRWVILHQSPPRVRKSSDKEAAVHLCTRRPCWLPSAMWLCTASRARRCACRLMLHSSPSRRISSQLNLLRRPIAHLWEGKETEMRPVSGMASSLLFALVLGLAGCRPLVNNSHSTGPLAYPILINPLALWSRSKGLFIQIYIQDEYLWPCCVLESHCSQDIGAFNMPCHVINNTRVRAGKLSIVTEQIVRQTSS